MGANKNQKYTFIEKIKKVYGENLSGKTVAVWGLAFKNDTDDIRESVAIEIVRILRGMGAKIKAYDPAAISNAKKVLGEEGIVFTNNKEECLDNSNFLVILTEWKEFVTSDINLLKKVETIFDGRNLLDVELMKKENIKYFCIGK
jgi:UDPglucose 6-dehydrogenase